MQYQIKKNELNSWLFESARGVKNIRAAGLSRLKDLPTCFNINGDWHIFELVDNGTNYPNKKYICKINI